MPCRLALRVDLTIEKKVPCQAGTCIDALAFHILDQDYITGEWEGEIEEVAARDAGEAALTAKLTSCTGAMLRGHRSLARVLPRP